MDKRFSRRAIFGAAGLIGLGLAGQTRAGVKRGLRAGSFDVTLSGAAQVPTVETKGSGTAHLTYNTVTRELTWLITYENLSGPVTMAHVHGPAGAGKNAGVKLWLSQKDSAVNGPIGGKATLSAEDAKEMMAGEWYINIHTKDHPGGEIRGQMMPPAM